MSNINKLYNNAKNSIKNLDNLTAIEYYKKILNENNLPNKKKYLNELAELYKKINKFDGALECYLNIITNDPSNGVVLNEIGICYFNLFKFKEALGYFFKVLKIKELPDIYNNAGNCFINLKQYKLGEMNFLKSYNIDGNDGAKRALGNIYYYIKQYDKSLEFLKKITNKQDSDLYNMSFTYLSKREFKKGFELYETRLKSNNINKQTGLKERVDIPQIADWNGVDKCDKLLVLYEQGIGDNIQFFRFIIELSNKYPTMKIFYFCKNTLAHIFKKYENIEIIDNVVFFNYDYKIFIMSLPRILKLDRIKQNQEQYIKISDDKLLYWKERLQHLKRYKVGFVYNGLLSTFIEKYIPLSEFEKLCELDIDLICIHKKSEIQEELLKINFKGNIHFFDIDTEVPFEDTIHILKNIDLLISIDTYIVHLAGVLNVPTWLLLGYSEWRWSNEDKTTYWYDSVELIRRSDKDKEFKDLIYRVKDKLYDKLKDKI
jgi:ADP-heptose:LPS heptosyltransferase/Tfp pilus assembly protein PilF